MMNEYHIILEEILTPAQNRKYIDYMRQQGWIHTNIKCKRKKDDCYYLSLTCTPELLGKVTSYLLSQVGWIIIEQIERKSINRDDCADYQHVIPF